MHNTRIHIKKPTDNKYAYENNLLQMLNPSLIILNKTLMGRLYDY